jgi:hypothetical protein
MVEPDASDFTLPVIAFWILRGMGWASLGWSLTKEVRDRVHY